MKENFGDDIVVYLSGGCSYAESHVIKLHGGARTRAHTHTHTQMSIYIYI